MELHLNILPLMNILNKFILSKLIFKPKQMIFFHMLTNNMLIGLVTSHQGLLSRDLFEISDDGSNQSVNIFQNAE